jgi:hypothetical protein
MTDAIAKKPYSAVSNISPTIIRNLPLQDVKPFKPPTDSEKGSL